MDDMGLSAERGGEKRAQSALRLLSRIGVESINRMQSPRLRRSLPLSCAINVDSTAVNTSTGQVASASASVERRATGRREW
jgi:hypothetical protein